jgi:hypothetical protein
LGPFTATKFLLSQPHSQPISGFLFCHFYRFYSQIPLLLAFLAIEVIVHFPAGVPVAVGILAVANIPVVACFPPAVAGES